MLESEKLNHKQQKVLGTTWKDHTSKETNNFNGKLIIPNQ